MGGTGMGVLGQLSFASRNHCVATLTVEACFGGHGNTRQLDAGFMPIDGLPSCYWHEGLKLMFSVL